MTPYLKKWLIVALFAPVISLVFILMAAGMLLVPFAVIIWPDLLLPLEDTHASK